MLVEYYPIIRLIHLCTIVLSISFFTVRGYWMWFSPQQLENKWVKIAPHIIDTILLASGIALIMLTQQYPHQQPWLLAKLVALVAYIGLGTMALKRAPTRPLKLIFFTLAILVFTYIACAALTRTHTPWTSDHFLHSSTAPY